MCLLLLQTVLKEEEGHSKEETKKKKKKKEEETKKAEDKEGEEPHARTATQAKRKARGLLLLRRLSVAQLPSGAPGQSKA